MAENFYTILTDVGLAKIANSQVTGVKVNLVEMAVGDGNGSYYNPTSRETALRREVWRGPIGSIASNVENPKWIVNEGVIPAAVGGFSVREVGLFDAVGDMIAIGKYPETYKPVIADGSSKDLYIRMIIEVANAASVTLKVDPTVVIASRKYVDDKVAASSGAVNNAVQQISNGTITILPLQTTDKTLAGAINEVMAKADVNAESLTTHKAEKATHIQAGERDNWNAKATPENVRTGIEQTAYSIAKSLPDAEGSFTTVEYKRKTDGKLAVKSVLSGGVAPLYTTRTITYYGVNGSTVEKTDVFALTYNADGVLIGEV